MLRLKGSKTMTAAVLGGFALMVASISTAQADNWKGHGNGWGHGHGNGWGHGKGWKHGHGGGWGGGNVIIRNGYYYAPPPRVYYAPPPVYYAPPPPVYYAPPPPPVYYQPAPLLNLQFRL